MVRSQLKIMKLKYWKIINIMNELDCVQLIKPFKNLKLGTKGCIVLKCKFHIVKYFRIIEQECFIGDGRDGMFVFQKLMKQ